MKRLLLKVPVAPTIMIWLVSMPLVAQTDWVEFDDVTSTHIVADEGAPDPVGLTDPFEKDLISGDVDKDGDLDLVIARKVRFSTPGGKRNVLFMNEGSTFVDRTANFIPDFLDETDDRDVVLVDVDDDGWLDIVTVTTFSDQPRVYMNLRLDASQVWLGFEYDVLDNRIPPFTPGPKFCAVAFGDVDDDDDMDLFFIDYDNSLEDRLMINDGNGFFTDETDTRLTPAMSQSAFGTDAQIEDMNGDSFPDIVKLSTLGGNPNSVRIFYNNPANPGFFDNHLPIHHAYTGAPYMMEVGDLNNDLRPDIYVVDDGQDEYLINTTTDTSGASTFTTLTVTTSSTTSFGGNVKLEDLDGDGYRDVILADVDTDFQFCDRQPAGLQNLGDTPNVTLLDPLDGTPPIWMPIGTFDFEVFDANGDGALDLWAGTCTGNRLYFNRGPIFNDSFESGDTTSWSDTVS